MATISHDAQGGTIWSPERYSAHFPHWSVYRTAERGVDIALDNRWMQLTDKCDVAVARSMALAILAATDGCE